MLPRMLHCKLLRSKIAHARIVSIDVSKALAAPGVVAVATGKDLPTPFGILPVSQDEHALCTDRVRFVGDPVAAVAARRRGRGLRRPRSHRRRVRGPAPDRLDRRRPRARGDPDPRLRRLGQHPQARLDGVRRHRRGLRRADRVYEDLFFYEGNTHLPARAARLGRRLRAGRQADALVLDPDAALRAPRARRRSWTCRRRRSASSRRPTAAASAASPIPSTTRSSSRSCRASRADP